MRITSLAAAFAALALAATVSGQPGGPVEENNPALRLPDFAADLGDSPGIIVKLRSGGVPGRVQAQAAGDAVSKLAARGGFAIKEHRALPAGLHVLKPERLSGETFAEQLARVRADADVEFAEPDYRRYPHAFPNDPLYSGQWYLQNRADTPSAVNAEAAWDFGSGDAGVVIAVIDTGVLFDHPDLKRAHLGGRVLPGYDFISNAAAANDGNGRDADASDAGDWVTQQEANQGPFAGCSVSSSSWHGTRVAGIIGALTNNSEGLTGSTWSPWILPVRALGKCGGYDSDILEAMAWAGGLHVNGVPDNPYPAKVENLSLGATGRCGAAYAERDLAARGARRARRRVCGQRGRSGRVAGELRGRGRGHRFAARRHEGRLRELGPAGGRQRAGRQLREHERRPVPVLDRYDLQHGNAGAGLARLHEPNQRQRRHELLRADRRRHRWAHGRSERQLGVRAANRAFARGSHDAVPRVCRSGRADVPYPRPSKRFANERVQLHYEHLRCRDGQCGALRSPRRCGRSRRCQLPRSSRRAKPLALSGAGSGGACGRTISSYSWEVVGGAGVLTGPNNTATTSVNAPATGSFTVRLTVTDDAGRQDSAEVAIRSTSTSTSAPAVAGNNACPADVTPPAAISVSVSPTAVTIEATNGNQQFAATVANAQSDSSVTWAVNGIVGGDATVGTISIGGNYEAPAAVPSPATVTVTATSIEDPTKSGSAEVTITAAALPPPTSSPPAVVGTAVGPWRRRRRGRHGFVGTALRSRCARASRQPKAMTSRAPRSYSSSQLLTARLRRAAYSVSTHSLGGTHMKRLNSVIAVLGLVAGAAVAQPPPGLPPGGRFDMDDLTILLDLDAYQKGEVERVLTEQRAAVRAAREEQRAALRSAANDERPSREEMLARREQNREELFGKLQNTLTELQLTKLKILMEAGPGGRGPRGGSL